MKIAFIRGPFLNPWELQTYLPLLSEHEFVPVGADWQFYSKAFPPSLERIPRPHLWYAGSARMHPTLPVALNRLRSWTGGKAMG